MDVSIESLHQVLKQRSFGLTAADTARFAATCPGSSPGTVNFLHLLAWLDSAPSQALGRETADRQLDNLTTASPWQVRLFDPACRRPLCSKCSSP